MAAATCTPLQQLHDSLHTRWKLSDNSAYCAECNRKFSGNAGRIYEHLKDSLAMWRGAPSLKSMISEKSGTKFMVLSTLCQRARSANLLMSATRKMQAQGSSRCPSSKACRQLAVWGFTRPRLTGCRIQAFLSPSSGELQAAVAAAQGGCEACAWSDAQQSGGREPLCQMEMCSCCLQMTCNLSSVWPAGHRCTAPSPSWAA